MTFIGNGITNTILTLLLFNSEHYFFYRNSSAKNRLVGLIANRLIIVCTFTKHIFIYELKIIIFQLKYTLFRVNKKKIFSSFFSNKMSVFFNKIKPKNTKRNYHFES